MAQTIVLNGQSYTIPDVSEDDWGLNLSNYFIAIPQAVLQKSGGAFALTADVNFGASFGLVGIYYKSRTANVSTSGVIRLAVTDTIGWRNNANGGNLLLSVDASDRLVFNGTSIISNAITALTGDVTATGPGSVASTIAAGVVTDAKVSASAAITRSKLATGTAYRILANTSGGVISENAAITASRAVASDANGQLVAATTTATELGYVNGVTSALQTQMDLKAPKASPTFTGVVTVPLTASRALITGGSSELSPSATTATELGYVSGVTSALQTQMDLKAPKASPAFTGTVTTPLTASRALTTGTSSELAISATTSTELGYVNGVTSAIQTQINTKLASSANASQSDQETATSTTTYVTPGVQQYHPSAAKAWVNSTSAAVLSASYNITSIADNTTGSWTINIGTDFSSANYAGVAFIGVGTSDIPIILNQKNGAAGTFQVYALNTAGALVDPNGFDKWSWIGMGDQ